MGQNNERRGKHARLPEQPDSNRRMPSAGAPRSEFNHRPGIRPVVMPQQREGGVPSVQGYDRSRYGAGRPKKKASRARKVALGVLVAVLVLVVGAGAAAALYLNSLNDAISIKDSDEAMEIREALQAPAASSNPRETDAYYTLLIGSDARSGDTASRSDVLILARTVPSEGKVTMVSIPRDTKVEISGYGTQKINAAYAYGGVAGAVKAASEFAGVPITHYAEVHFQELESLVDILGGVYVDVPVSNDQTGASNTGIQLSAGYQLLDGEQALAFARERYGYARGDFQRADNQRLVATAIMKQVLQTPALEMPSIVQRLASCVTTDMSVTDVIGLAQAYRSAGDLTVYSALAPSSTETIDGVSYVITDEAAWRAMMQKVDAGEDPGK
ncbi:LCP family protein [Gordonibacter sp. Marseille-P4307]|uniref:LCP family protein n=1 Tax=Gordonibacter sp. Marseille-P4307 TaxID=2161815 RepID=UPI001F14D98C|nr:LCP family protein [Gordonibacter sp. Marseille-P4307]